MPICSRGWPYGTPADGHYRAHQGAYPVVRFISTTKKRELS